MFFQYPDSSFQLEIPEFELPNGQSLGIVGPSGCGKTTFLNLLSGLLQPQKGAIEVEGQDLSDLSGGALRRWRSREVGFIFQDFRLFEYLNLYENLRIPLVLSGRTASISETRIEELASEVGIGELLSKKPNSVSQGEKQRAGIVRALVHGPSLVIADEPTGNLDPENKRRSMQLLIDITRSAGAILVVVTHDHSLLPLFDRAVEFDNLRS
jgi:ABC-type lipoprotein export system ATPase subunit